MWQFGYWVLWRVLFEDATELAEAIVRAMEFSYLRELLAYRQCLMSAVVWH